MRKLFLAALSVSCLHFSAGEAEIHWAPPVNLSLASKTAVNAQLAAGSNDVSAIWSRSDGSNYLIQVTAAPFAGQWSKPLDISQQGKDAFFGNIAADKEGNAIAVWSRFNGRNYVVQAADRRFKGGWQGHKNLSNPGRENNNAMHPQVAISGNGQAIVVWQRNDGVNNIIQAVTKKKGAAWSSPDDVTVANGNGVGDVEPQIAIDKQGNATLVWINDSSSTIRAAIKPANGNWTQPNYISLAGNKVNHPRLVVDSYGNATAVWVRNDGSNYIIQSAFKSYGGVWSAPVDLSEAGQDALIPQVAVDSSGNLAAVWQRWDGENTVIQVSRKSFGGNWSPPIVISLLGEDASEPQVVSSPSGEIAAVWRRSNGSNFVIQSASRALNGDWTVPTTLSEAGQDALSPQISVDESGHFTVVWQRSNGSNTIIQSTFGLSY